MTPYDQRIANDAAAVEQCMKLGAVILKPSGHKPLGFDLRGAPYPPGAPKPQGAEAP